jgi:hypothetical protein
MRRLFTACCLLLLHVHCWGLQGGLSSLAETVAILKEVENINVEEQSATQALLSWQISSGRKIDNKTLKILEQLTDLAKQDEAWDFYFSVFASVDNAGSVGQSLSDSRYKADILRQALLQSANASAHVESVGLGNKLDDDRVYLLFGKKLPDINRIAVPQTAIK